MEEHETTGSLLDAVLASGGQLRLGWRERAESTRPPAGAEQLQRASTSAAAAGNDQEPSCSDAGFLTHKISKLDTLAGIAIKYSVPISDIKRFNGLMSDSALHGMDCLLIPTKLQPVTKEVQQMFAQIATGLGRDPVVHSEPGIHPCMGVSSQLPRALDLMDSATLDEVPWWCRCGMCNTEDESMTRTCPLASSEDQRMPESLMASSASAGPTRFREQIRRRYQPAPGEDDEGVDAGTGQRSDEEDSHHHAHGQRSSCSPAVQANAAATLLSSIGKKIGESGSALMLKIKQAAAQPSGPTWGHHNVLSSLRQGLLPKGNLTTSRQDGAQLRAASSLPPPHQKLDKKCE